MKRISLFCLLIFMISISSEAKVKQNEISEFIKKQRQDFSNAYGERQDKALAKELGHGLGIYVEANLEKTFQWHACISPQGYVEFRFDILLHPNDRYKIWVETDQGSDDSWDIRDEDLGITWLITDNNWLSCLQKNNCDYKKILDNYLEKIMKFSFFKSLKAEVYY